MLRSGRCLLKLESPNVVGLLVLYEQPAVSYVYSGSISKVLTSQPLYGCREAGTSQLFRHPTWSVRTYYLGLHVPKPFSAIKAFLFNPSLRRQI